MGYTEAVGKYEMGYSEAGGRWDTQGKGRRGINIRREGGGIWDKHR